MQFQSILAPPTGSSKYAENLGNTTLPGKPCWSLISNCQLYDIVSDIPFCLCQVWSFLVCCCFFCIMIQSVTATCILRHLLRQITYGSYWRHLYFNNWKEITFYEVLGKLFINLYCGLYLIITFVFKEAYITFKHNQISK